MAAEKAAACRFLGPTLIAKPSKRHRSTGQAQCENRPYVVFFVAVILCGSADMFVEAGFQDFT